MADVLDAIGKRKLRPVLKQIEKEKGRIAAARDKLRDLLCELESIVDDSDEAVDGIDRVIDALSKYL